MSDYEYVFEGKEPPEQPPARELTSRQRACLYMLNHVANDLDGGQSRAEQHTASLLRIAADALKYDYEAELVALARAWRREVEAGNGPG